MVVGVFGGWRPVDGDPLYNLARDYGRALGAAGHCVLTGGYSGVMEAVSRGAVESGAKTMGVTCPEIDRLLPVNRWVTEEIKTQDLYARLAACFRRIDVALFFPGRSGTATELVFSLELREKGILRRPVFLSDNFWDELLRAHAAVNSKLPYPASAAGNSPAFIHCGAPTDFLAQLARAE